jgi:peptide/nickel transport system ATP-binding protein
VFQGANLVPFLTAKENLMVVADVAGKRGKDIDRRADLLLDDLGLGHRKKNTPPQLSGGERQRVAIARALAAQPDLLVCDEVTSALDDSEQAAVLELLQELRRDLQLSMLFITHNLGVVACIADSVLVMDRGTICEAGAVNTILTMPEHDYTRRLLDAAPCLPENALGVSA